MRADLVDKMPMGCRNGVGNTSLREGAAHSTVLKGLPIQRSCNEKSQWPFCNNHGLWTKW